MDGGRRSIDDEEEPKQLVAALHNDMLPHASADQGLCASVRLLQQQVRRRVLSCQCCREPDTGAQSLQALELNVGTWPYHRYSRIVSMQQPYQGRIDA